MWGRIPAVGSKGKQVMLLLNVKDGVDESSIQADSELMLVDLV